jgi:dGTPase
MTAPYAVPPARVEDRRYPEPPHSYRGEFQRDRDRIIHSRAFRRLENKTQVFTRRTDHFRTRLTHTIEVAQISRTVAAQLGLNEDLVETLALAHDIGHPPFGHSGERALNDCMKRHGSYFDHNLHALRIVEYFEERYASFPGLNLTFQVREGIVKHSHDYSAAEHPELQEYLLDLRPPLEAQLIDLTDEIAYNSADLDDGFEARMLELGEIRANVVLFDRALREAEELFPTARAKFRFNEALKRVINTLTGDLIVTTGDRLLNANIQSLEELRHYPSRLAAFSPEIDAERQQLKEFLYRNLYFNDRLKGEKEEGEQVIEELFEGYFADPELLPHGYQEKIAGGEPVERSVCDYIAGMTDTYILEQLRQMRKSKKMQEKS